MSFTSHLQATNLMVVVGAKSPVDRRRKALERVNKELSRGKYETALSLVKQFKSSKHHGCCLSAFASAKLLPKKSPPLSDTFERLIDSVSRTFESVSAEAIQEHNKATTCEEDRFAVVQHESGHFLVGYLLGVLPRRYEIPDLEAMRDDDNVVTGRVEFVGFEFLKQVGGANQFMRDDVSVSSKTLNNFSCVVLGGMVTEHMLFGYSEGFYSDAVKLESVLQWRGFTEREEKAGHVRWAASNAVFLLHSYSEARVSLAEAMCKGKPISACIEAIESAIL
ncbi:hypothetical protein Rs2_20234 [Raphanus sativus]|uniref:Uncharacterized protein LOC108859470 n=1 Tax=Raphanus sativus TaxID=3726 RepID=A0A6J0NX04_RAPSA|nr:uncharacterized protein LOC108859470 [Raphanus sativus]KAJ4893440.1 hypothetical protein Rs2_20234 [Raphanus sativus]